MVSKIPDYLKVARVKQKMTLEELSLKSGVSIRYISEIENKKANPTLEVVERLAGALGVNIEISYPVDDQPDKAAVGQ